MLYLLDTANVGEIEKAAEVFPLAGVTTNPSIIAQEKRNFFSILKEIRAIIGDRMDTDVIAGMESGLATVLVLSGCTSRTDVNDYPYRPTYILNGVGDIPSK